MFELSLDINIILLTHANLSLIVYLEDRLLYCDVIVSYQKALI